MTQATDTAENVCPAKRARRVLGLFEVMVSFLREEPVTDRRRLDEVVGIISRASALLSAALAKDLSGLEKAIVECNRMLDDAVHALAQSPGLVLRRGLYLEAMARIQTVLYPIALASVEEKARPPRFFRDGEFEVKKRPAGIERRRVPRVPLQTEVTIEGHSNFYTGFTQDISTGGLFVCTKQLLPVGTKIDLVFRLPDGKRIAVKGEVRWVRDIAFSSSEALPGMGIQFENLRPEDLEAVERFVKERAPLFYDELS
jgi:uncharacterized protein (TIGR02266 family)